MEKTKKSIWQKALTYLLAALTVFTTLFSSSSGLGTNVHAAETRQVKRIYSSNYTDKYGMKSNTQISAAATLKGGTNWSIIVMDNGNLAYCVEPEKGLIDNAAYSEKKNSLTDNQQKLLGRIFLYSYTQTPADITNLDSYMPQYLATQLLVWEVIVGQRNDSFEYVSNGYAKVSSMIDKFNDKAVCDNVRKYYNAYESAIKSDGKTITFAYDDPNIADDFPFNANDDGTYTFTDKNAQLNNFDVTVTNGSVVSKNATQLKIKANYNQKAQIHFVQNNCNESGERSGFTVFSDGKNQDVGEAKADPREYYVYLKGVETGNVEIKKTADNGSVVGFKFEITNDDGYKATGVTQTGGYLYFKDLAPGKYTITEKPTPEQRLNYNSVLSKVVFVNPGKTTTVNFNNTHRTGHLSVAKYSEDNIVEGIGFQLMSYYLDNNDNEVVVKLYDTLYTDENGYVEWNDLPYYSGNHDLFYEIAEVSKPDKYIDPVFYIPGYDDNVSFDTVNFNLLGDDIAVSCYNELKRSDVLIVKKDYETGETVPREGTEFQIYDANGELVILTDDDDNSVSTFATDSTGKIKLPEPLVYGSYQLVEVKAPEGYVIDPTPVNFSVTQDGAVVTVEKKNSEQKANIVVTKVGDSFSTVINGEDDTYKPEFAEANLSGAVFDVIAAQDIYYSSGKVRIEKDTVVDTITTGEDGTATSKDLYLGDYCVVERKAPEGYVLNNTVYLVTLEYAGQEVPVYSSMFSVDNAYQQVKINVSKYIESNEDFNIKAENAVQYVNFGLFAAEDIEAADGSVIPADGLIEEIGLNADFTTSFNTKLPFGKYYVKEISTDEHYILSDEVYEFEFSYEGQDTTTVEIQTDEFTNELKKGSVEGLKVDADTNVPLSGALIGLFSGDETEFTEDNAILTETSAINGKFSFSDIPYGAYQVAEIKAPTGYVLTEEVFPVNIDEDGQLIEITIKNEAIKGSVTVNKFDSETDKPLSGAIFTVYKDYDNDGKYNGIDEEYGVLTENADGTYTLSGVRYGDYLLKETKAPEGYVIDENYYSFKIRKDGEVVIISNDESTDKFYNKPITGDVKGLKINSDDKSALGGALIGLFGGDETEFTAKNAIKTVTSDKNGKFEFKNIHYGNYLVAEIKAPTGFVLTDKTFPVIIANDGDIIEITMENKPIKGNVEGMKVGEENEPLSGALIGLFVDDESDFTEDTAIATVETAEDGYFEFKDILYGKYIVAEIKAPTGYILSDKTFPVNIDEDGVTISIEIENNKIYGDVEGIKVGESGEPLSGAVIGLFSVDETDFTVDTAIATVETTEDGKFAFKGIEYGEYIIAEIKAPVGYILTDEKFPVVIDENGKIIEVTIANNNIYGNVSGIKLDEADKPLSGALIGLFYKGETTFSEDTAIMTDTSDNNGFFEFKKIKYGEYVVAEIKAPTGYVLTDEIFPVVIDENDETISIEIINTEIKGSVVVNKYDAETDTPLSGAAFSVYLDRNSNGIVDDNEYIIGVLSEVSKGVYKLTDIPFGEYILKETLAPDGYLIDKGNYAFVIDTDGKEVVVTNSDSSDRFYNAQTTTTVTTTTTTTTTSTTTTTTVTTTETTTSTETTTETTTTTEITTTSPEITTVTITSETITITTTPSPHTGDTKGKAIPTVITLGMLSLGAIILTKRKKNTNA